MGGEKRAPLLIPILCWIGGIVAGKFLDIPTLAVILIAFFISLLSLSKKVKIINILLLFFLLGFLRNSTHLSNDHIQNIFKYEPEFLQPITGKIVSEVIPEEDIFSFVLELNSIKNHPAKGKINFSTFQDSLQYGDVIQTVAQISRISQNTNPLSFDYAEFLRSKQIFGRGFTKTTIQVIENNPNKLKKLVIQIRKFLRKRIENRFGKHADFVKAIVIGEKESDSVWRSRLTKAGLSHILAVSGLHVGIISLIVIIFLNLFIRSKSILRFITIILLILYAAICNWSPSVTRAVIMISLYLLYKMLQRKPDKNNILLLSLFFICLINPNELFSIGLQMSFTAVFVLLNILPNIRFIKMEEEEIKALKFGKKLLNYALILIMTSLILGLFLAPLTMFYFNQFNLNGIIGNLLAIPLIAFLLPLAILNIFLPGFLLPIYQQSFSLLMLVFEKWSIFSSTIPLHFNFVSISLTQVIMLFLLLLSISFWKKFTVRNYWKILLLIVSMIIFIFPFGIREKKLKITFFDCHSFGDIHLIESPANENILIDTGPPDSFKYNAFPYFTKSSIRKLDYLIITHAHNDHYGGMEFVLENLIIENLVVTDEFQTSRIWKKNENLINKEKCNIITISDTTHLEFTELKFKIIHPDKEFTADNINDLSIVARLDLDELSLLFTGDLEEEGEEYLLEKYPEFLDCDFLKIGHHGSNTSSSVEFIQKVSPFYGFIPTSLKNRFNFPHQQTLDRFQFLQDHLFIAGRDGALQVRSDGKTAHLKTFLTDQEFIEKELQ